MNKPIHSTFSLPRGICMLIRQFPPEERVMMYDAIVDYGLTGREPTEGSLILDVVRPLIDANERRFRRRKYRAYLSRNSSLACARVHAPGNVNVNVNANVNEHVNENVNENENENEKEKENEKS